MFINLTALKVNCQIRKLIGFQISSNKDSMLDKTKHFQIINY